MQGRVGRRYVAQLRRQVFVDSETECYPRHSEVIVPKLVIDEAALQLVAARISGIPICAGPGGDFLEPGVVDLLEENDNNAWQPGDARTKALTLAVEATRALRFQARPVLEPGPRGRAVLGLAVPTCNLVDVVLQLCGTLNDEESRKKREGWLAHDQSTYRDGARRLRKKHRDGSVRAARNKLAAHLDAGVYEARVRLTLDQILPVVGDALIVLLVTLNHRSESFSWIRGLGALADGRQVVETMQSYPIAMRWLTDEDGRVLDVGCLQLAADPLVQLQDDVLTAVETYNELAQLEGVSAPKIWVTMRKPSGKSQPR